MARKQEDVTRVLDSSYYGDVEVEISSRNGIWVTVPGRTDSQGRQARTFITAGELASLVTGHRVVAFKADVQ